ncbi:MAG: DMT family transporter [Candidatus Lokiarchaeota archaeon]
MILIYLQLILMVLLWSFSFVAVDISVAYISPLSLALIRFVFASISFLIIDLIKYIKSKNKSNPYDDKKKMDHGILSNFSTNQWILLIIASFSGISIFFFTQYTAIQMIGPSFPALVVCLLAPVLISIFAIFIFGEKLKTIKVIGYIIASVGAFLLITGGNLSVLNPDSVNFLGYLFALLTPILWSVYSTLTKKLTLSESTLLITKYISYLGSIELFFFSLY